MKSCFSSRKEGPILSFYQGEVLGGLVGVSEGGNEAPGAHRPWTTCAPRRFVPAHRTYSGPLLILYNWLPLTHHEGSEF